MTTKLTLYSTTHCHLCELAEDMLHKIEMEYSLIWEKIEITDEACLLAEYETKIPVIRINDSIKILNWPFSEDDIRSLISD